MNLDDIPAHLRDRVKAVIERDDAGRAEKALKIDIGGETIELTKIGDGYVGEIDRDHPAFKALVDALRPKREPLAHMPDDMRVDATTINLLVDILNAHTTLLDGLVEHIHHIEATLGTLCDRELERISAEAKTDG